MESIIDDEENEGGLSAIDKKAQDEENEEESNNSDTGSRESRSASTMSTDREAQTRSRRVVKKPARFKAEDYKTNSSRVKKTALNKHAKRALEELDNELEGTSVKRSAIDDDYNPNRPKVRPKPKNAVGMGQGLSPATLAENYSKMQAQAYLALAPSPTKLPRDDERQIIKKLDSLPEFVIASAGFMHFIKAISDERMVSITKSLMNLQVPPGKSEVHEVAQVVRHLWSSLPFELRLEFEIAGRNTFLADVQMHDEKASTSTAQDTFDQSFIDDYCEEHYVNEERKKELMTKLLRKPCMPRTDCAYTSTKGSSACKQSTAGNAMAIKLNCCENRVVVTNTNEVIDHFSSCHYMATFYACHFCKQTFPTIEILRVHDHSPCSQFAEYKFNTMKDPNQELEMAHAFFYLSCTSCGLWLTIRSQYSNLNMRNKAWNFFKCSCENHEFSFLVPLTIYCMEQPAISSDPNCKWIFSYLSTPKSLPVGCSQCGIERFSSVNEIEEHFKKVPHDKDVKTCGKCNIHFGTETMLIHHLKTHFNESAGLATFLSNFARYFPPPNSDHLPPVTGWPPKSYAIGGVHQDLSAPQDTYRYVTHCMPLPKRKLALALKANYYNVDRADDQHCYRGQHETRFDLGYESFDYSEIEDNAQQKEIKAKLNTLFKKQMGTLAIGTETQITDPEEMQKKLALDSESLSPNKAVSAFADQPPKDSMIEDMTRVFTRQIQMPVYYSMDPVINNLLRRSYTFCKICKCILVGSQTKKHLTDEETKNHETSQLYSVAEGAGGVVSCVIPECSEKFCSIFALRKHAALNHSLYIEFRPPKKETLVTCDKDISINRLVDMNRTDAGRSYNSLLLDTALDMPTGFLKEKPLPKGVAASTASAAASSLQSISRVPLSQKTACASSASRKNLPVSPPQHSSNKKIALFRSMQIGRGRYLRMCDHCSFRTYLRSEMATHLIERHIAVCNYCGEAFLAQTNETNHSAVCSNRIQGSIDNAFATCGVCTHRGRISNIYKHLLDSHLEVVYFYTETGKLEPAIWNVNCLTSSIQPNTLHLSDRLPQTPVQSPALKRVVNATPSGSSSMDGSPARDASPAASSEEIKSNGDDEDDDIIVEKTVTPAEKTVPTRAEELSVEIRVEKDDIVVGGQNQPGFKDDEGDDNMVANESNRAATPIAIDPIENNEDEEIQAIAIVKHHSGTTSSSLAVSRAKKAKCTKCSQAFMSNASLRAHIETDHKHDAGSSKLTDKTLGIPTDKCSYFCVNCCIAFENQKDFSHHKAAHGQTYGHMCRYCSQFTFNPSHQEVHEKSHVENAQKIAYGCGKCLKAFKQDSLLYWHLHREHGMRLFFFCKSCFMGSVDGSVIFSHITNSNSCARYRSWHPNNIIGMCPLGLINYQPNNEEKYMENYAAREIAGHVSKPSDCSHRSLITHLTDAELICCATCGSLPFQVGGPTPSPSGFYQGHPPRQQQPMRPQTYRPSIGPHPQSVAAAAAHQMAYGRNPQIASLPAAQPSSSFYSIPQSPQIPSPNYVNQTHRSSGGPRTNPPNRLVPLTNGQPGQFVSMDTGEIISSPVSRVAPNQSNGTARPPATAQQQTNAKKPPSSRPNGGGSSDVITVSDDEDEQQGQARKNGGQDTQQGAPSSKAATSAAQQNNQICHICNEKISRPNLHHLHDPSKRQTNYICLNCGLDSSTEIAAMKHFVTKHLEQQDAAKKGGKPAEFKVKFELKCPFCNEVHISIGAFRMHINTHHQNEAPYSSRWCNLRFCDEARRIAHDKAHEEYDKEHRTDGICCALCGSLEQWKFKTPGCQEELSHLHTHGLRIFSMCRLCFFCFENDGNKKRFIEHFQSKHMQGDKCSFCKFSVNSFHPIKRHCIDAFKSYENTTDLMVKTNFETKEFFGVKLSSHMARLE
ncbi:hypothetical protein WR25_15202 [Diploscapter pachys]|uniref:C2H2-type domain-containing protein n=1 Tax=Diploscapter pachys TaxID=2018661 RepID=A0A2A2K7V6_9BILA|nr:hypothetical protein WR25_15202 [Diploscapter pachys]